MTSAPRRNDRRATLPGCAAAAIGIAPRLLADADVDWGLSVQRQLNERSQQVLGIGTPLRSSALGPYTGADSTNAIRAADGLRVSLVSSAVHFSADQMALWPSDNRPTYLFVCDESSSNPATRSLPHPRPRRAAARLTA